MFGYHFEFFGYSKGVLTFVLFRYRLVYTAISCDISCGANRFFYSISFVNGSGQGSVMGTIGLVGTDRIRKKKRPGKGAQSHHHYSLGLCLQDGCYLVLQEGFRYQRWRPCDGQWPSERGICLCMRASDTYYHGPRSTCKVKTC